MKLRAFTLAASVAALTAVATPAMAETTMVISSWLPPTHVMNAKVWPEFIRRIEEATNGEVKGEIRYGLGSPPAQTGLVEDGAADASWIFHGYEPGRFVTTRLVELPGLPGSSADASAAHWQAYEQVLHEAEEHDGLVLAALFTHGPAQLHMTQEINGLSDLAGMKIRVAGGVSSMVGDLLGVAGIQAPAPQVYEVLSNRVADGTLFPGDVVPILRLPEVTPVSYTMPGGFYRGSFALIVSPDFMDSLDDDVRAQVESVFGEDLSRAAGAAWDEGHAAGMAAQAGTEGNRVIPLSDAEVAAWNEKIGPLQEAVLAEVEARGVDANKAFAIIKSAMGVE